MPSQFLSKADHQRLRRFPDEVPRADLDAYFYLSQNDLDLIGTLRGDDNRLGFSLQLCGLRYLGFFPVLAPVPDAAVTHLSTQLGVASEVLETYGRRDRTLRDHQGLVMLYLDFRRATPLDLAELEGWLLQRALEHDEPKVLFEMACRHLLHLKVVRLGVTRIEKFVGTARRQAEEVTFGQLKGFLTGERRELLDGLLSVQEGEDRTRLLWLQRTPMSNKTTAITATLEKLRFLKESGVADWNLGAVHPNRLKWLADRGSAAQAQGLRELQAATRYPVLSAFLQQRLHLFTDAVVEMVDVRLWDLHNECKRAFQEDRLAATQTINETLSVFKTLGNVLLDEGVDDATVRNVAFEKLSQRDLERALQQANQLIRPERDAFVDYFAKRHRSVQNFSKSLLNTLEFKTGGRDQGLLRALTLVDDIHQGRRRKLPADAPTAFVPAPWQNEVMTQEGLDWRSYEIAALWVLRERLRSGDVYVAHSQRFRELESYFIPKAQWETQRAEVVELTRKPLSVKFRLEDKARELERVAKRVEKRLTHRDGDVRVEAGELILTPHKAEDDEPELAWLRQQLDQRLPRRDITNVIIDVDNASGFSAGLTHLSGSERRDKDLLLHLYGALLAQACNLGFRPMAESAELLYRRLLWCNRWYIREDSLSKVTAMLVEYQMKLPYSELWGGGMLSSSDGQRFPVRGDTRKARAQPNYFGYGKGVTFYTWALDRFAQYGSKAIPSTLRDATYVLDAILNNLLELEVLEHTTDTAGYTELIFALFDLLGMTFSPRLRDLSDQKLYRLPSLDLSGLPKLKAHLPGVINEEQIRSQWDEMLRLILSLKKGYVTSSLIVQKLQAYPRRHPLMRALQEYGRLIKTIHILNWYDDLGLRRRVSQQLNKGEALHRLRAAIFYGRHGQLDGMEDEPLDQVVGCLNVVSNIVIVWNTIHMARVVDELKAEGHKISDENLAKVWPTRFGHLNIIGRYHFATDEIRVADA